MANKDIIDINSHIEIRVLCLLTIFYSIAVLKEFIRQTAACDVPEDKSNVDTEYSNSVSMLFYNVLHNLMKIDLSLKCELKAAR